MQLPPELRAAADEYAAGLPFADLRRAAMLMSERYRLGATTASIQLAPAFRVAAYMATRFPATYGAASAVVGNAPWDSAESLLDLGGGAGAATWAARARWPGMARLTLIESDAAFVDAGRRWLPDAEWRNEDLRKLERVPPADVVISSYALSELGEEHSLRIARAAWDACRLGAIFVEPGSVRGFSLIRRLRELGGSIAAPCPDSGPCPLASGDWCHFASRVERTSLHRRLKEGTHGYEDEKFSYVILSKVPMDRARGARVIRHPIHHPGWIELRVCDNGAAHDLRVTKRDKARFRAARKAEWGDLLLLDGQVVDHLEDA